MNNEETTSRTTTKTRMLILEEISREMDKTVTSSEQSGPPTDLSNGGKLATEPKAPGVNSKVNKNALVFSY